MINTEVFTGGENRFNAGHLTDKPENFVVGITGRARAGKDTLTGGLVKGLRLLLSEQQIVHRSFAGPLKVMLEQGLGLKDKDISATDRYGKSYRVLVQTLGTEWGRVCIGEDIWVDVMRHRLQAARDSSSTPVNFVVSDVRFENEAEWVRENGILIHVVRVGEMDIEESSHISERGVGITAGDLMVDNSGTAEDLRLAGMHGISALVLAALSSHKMYGRSEPFAK